MTDSTIAIDEPSTIDKRLDTEQLVVATVTVQRERIQVAGATDVAIASVINVAPTTEYGLVVRNIPSGTQPVSIAATIQVDVTDEAARDLGKVDVALLDQYTPIDVDTGAGVVNALPITWRKASALAVEFGTSTDPVRTDPTGTTTQPVSGTVTANAGTGIFQVDVTDEPARDMGKIDIAAFDVALPTGDNNIGNVDVLTMPVDASATEVQGTVADGLAPVGNPVLIAGSDGTNVQTLTTTSGGALHATGNVASDGVDSGNPLKIGGIARTANPTAVAALDRVDAFFDDVGRQVIVPNQVRDLVVRQTTTISTTTETTILASAASTFHDLTLLTVSNTSAIDTRVDFRDATAGTIQFSLFVKAGAVVGFSLTTPMTQTTAANNWTAQLGTAVSDIRILVQAVKNV